MMTNYNTSYLDYSTLANYTGAYKDTTTFQYMKAKDDKSWDGASIKALSEKRFTELDTNRDGQISYEEAVASGGLFGKGNFSLKNTDNPIGVFEAISHGGKLYLREFAQVALYTDGTKSTKNPNNIMDGNVTTEESNDVMADLAEKTKNPYAALLAYNNTIGTNAKNYGLDQFIPEEQEQRDALQEEKTSAWDTKVETAKWLGQTDRTTDQTNRLLWQLLNKRETEQQQQNQGGFGQIIASVLPALIGGLLPLLFGGGNSWQGQQQANPLAGLLAGLQGNA